MSLVTEIVLMMGFVLMGSAVAYQIILPRMTHLLVLRYKTNKGSYIKNYNVREITKQDGSVWWVSFPFKDVKTVMPPGDAIEIMKGGRKFAEGHYISRDQIMWVKDKGTSTKDENEVWAKLEAFEATDRAILVQEFKQSELEKGMKFLSPEFIMPMAAFLMMAMVVGGAIIFGPDLVHSLSELQTGALERDKVQLETAKVQARITEALGLRVGLNITQTVGGQGGSPTLITGSEEPPTV